RRLAADEHAVHLYASRWDAAALPKTLQYHAVPATRSPRFLRPWFFASSCLKALRGSRHDVTIGFDKIWGLDVLYPQGGLYLATMDHNLLKYARPSVRGVVRTLKAFDLTHHSYAALERRQYLGTDHTLV